jgi:hypothetical protein
MVRTRVASSVVASVDYDDEASALEVEFVNGRVYRYYLVPHEVYERMVAADSTGRFFNEFVRAVYPSSRVR